jgi:Family of unknown function (DUF6481)
MKSYQEPGFQDRIGRAAEAKKKALDALRSGPTRDDPAPEPGRAAPIPANVAEKERRAGDEAANRSEA